MAHGLWPVTGEALLAGNNHRHIDQITLLANCAIESPCLFRIINNVKIQPLASNDAFQNGRSRIANVMRLAPSRIGNKINRLDLQNRSANARCSSTFENIDTFFFEKMPVKSTRRRPDWHLNQVKAQFGQSGNVTKRFLQMSRIAV
jgi:hypothetical protein